MNLLETLLTSAGSSIVATTVVAFLLKSWLEARLRASINHEYQKELAEIKSVLATQSSVDVQLMELRLRNVIELREAILTCNRALGDYNRSYLVTKLDLGSQGLDASLYRSESVLTTLNTAISAHDAVDYLYHASAVFVSAGLSDVASKVSRLQGELLQKIGEEKGVEGNPYHNLWEVTLDFDQLFQSELASLAVEKKTS